VVGGKVYPTTEGLLELLFQPLLKRPYTDEDLKNYRQILIDTNAHREDFNPKGKLLRRRTRKYNEIIKPLFLSGGSLVLNNSINKEIQYQDANQMINRLKKLILSKNAGNNNLQPEINMILSSLRKKGIIV
jgi:hypothetical protein